MEIGRPYRYFLFSILILFSESLVAAPSTPKPIVNPTSANTVPVKKVAATPNFCGEKQLQKDIRLESPSFWKLLTRQPVNVYLADTEKCYYKAQVVSLYEIKPPDGFAYWNYYRGTVTVYNVQIIKFSEIGKYETTRLTKTEIDQIAGKIKRFKKITDKELPNAQVLKVTVAANRIEESLRSYGSPNVHPEAKELTYPEFMQKMATGQVYDIRPESTRLKTTVKKAKILKITNPQEMALKIYSPSQMKRRQIDVLPMGLPKKDDPITIMSACSGEFSAYNALTLLRIKGYTNLSWFFYGYEGYRHVDAYPCNTPAKIPAAEVLDARNVAIMKLKPNVTVIDLRQEQSYMIIGATSIPYIQKVSDLNLAILRRDITLEKINEEDAGLNKLSLKSIPTTQTLILYGRNSYDWRPVKAAMVLQSLGYKTIYWYRDGMDDWVQKVLISPKYYHLNKKLTNRELY